MQRLDKTKRNANCDRIMPLAQYNVFLSESHGATLQELKMCTFFIFVRKEITTNSLGENKSTRLQCSEVKNAEMHSVTI